MTVLDNLQTRVRVLAVSADETDHMSLGRIFGHSAWELHSAGTCASAATYLSSEPTPVVLCATHLPDGDWATMLATSRRMARPPHVIVFSKSVDERLWAEVLNLGCYDLLSQPFINSEVYRSVGAAWRNWMDKRKVAAAAGTAAGAFSTVA